MSWKDDAKKRAKEKREGTTYKLVEGENTFRILPNKKGPDNAPYLEVRIHRNVGPDKETLVCGKNIDGEGSCWLCDVKIPELKKSASSAKQQQAEEIRAKDQFILQVSGVDTDTGKYRKPKPFWVSTGGAKSLSVVFLNLLSSSKRSYEDPVKGYNITIERTGTGFKDTRYGPPMPDESPSKVPPSILKEMVDLDELIDKYSSAKQKAAFLGRPAEEEEEEERPKKKGSKKPHREEEEEEEVDNEETEEEETEEEEEETEEEESDEPEDEEEEEESGDEEEEEEPEDEPEPEDEEEEEEEEEEPEDEDEEEEEKPKAKKPAAKKAPVKKAPAPAKKPAKKKR